MTSNPKSTFPQQFYSRYSFKDVIKNGGWKFLGGSAITGFVILFYFDFDISFLSINVANVILVVGILGPLLTGILSSTSEIKMENDVIFYKTIFTKWKTVILKDVHHISYFQKPVERFSIFPKAVFFKQNNNRIAEVEFLIPKIDTYKLLSLLYDKNIPVLLFNEFKDIQETDWYVKPD